MPWRRQTMWIARGRMYGANGRTSSRSCSSTPRIARPACRGQPTAIGMGWIQRWCRTSSSSRIAAKGLDVYRIGEESAKRAGAAKTRLITTIYETLKTVNERPEYAAVRQPVNDLLRHNFKVLTDAGVVIAIGSDQFRTSSVAEALEIHKAGLMPPAALLRALSTDGAATIFPSGAPFGLVDGARADFLVL